MENFHNIKLELPSMAESKKYFRISNTRYKPLYSEKNNLVSA